MEINFTEPYGRLCETVKDGELEIFNFKNKNEKVENMFIKRRIPFNLENKVLFDIVTPYGYGGSVIKETTAKEKEIRKKILQDARRAVAEGVKISIDQTGERIDNFFKVYYSTMDRNEADDYYYFSKSFFEQIHETMKEQFLYVLATLDGKVVSAALILSSEEKSFSFLAGTLEEYYKYHPEALVELTIIQWLKEKGLKKYILGGGHEGKDGIYHHKKVYARNGDCPFYVGRKVHDPITYNKLIELRKTIGDFDMETSCFPKYRT